MCSAVQTLRVVCTSCDLQRTSLSADTLNALMMISINGPPLAEVDWEAILTIWNNNTARGRYDAVWKADVAAQVADIRDLLAALD